MAIRNVFEVVSLKFILNRSGKADWEKEDLVREELNKYLNMYASNTSLAYLCALLICEEFVIEVEFSKGISFIIVTNILADMYLGTGNMLSIEYKESEKMVTVGISC